MSEKRKRNEVDPPRGDGRGQKKAKKGFQVGPDNLPDGTYKRKVKKIKANLIEKAQIKKQYAKVKGERERAAQAERPLPPPPEEAAEDVHEPVTAAPSTVPHPDRQMLMENEPESAPQEHDAPTQRERRRKPKTMPFKQEYEQAQQRKAEAEERRLAREEADRQRAQKIEERERFRKAMAKARQGGPNGQRKLGRESHVLLEKVKRMVGDTG